MGDKSQLSTMIIGTPGQHIRATLFSATLHRSERFFMRWQDRRPVSIIKPVFKRIDY
jgi:hypothetical protein